MPVESDYATLYYVLLINSNYGHISYRFRHIEA